ncbi:hypothetical protein [Rhizobium lentis]|uniref:hypothetical protein n=1 Tax=Rhizobium lentis TaxID=1138194 RepID=UPI001C82A666|nr:hypothetical protein [Rhizobium lentis]MBX4956015.1 hypothetical protein [Rhizobium lentis]MBX4985292.1 hypothetical protein [Rhizobium lentis]MBX5003737.1 hypothetical protein [Rhizobium lentis]
MGNPSQFSREIARRAHQLLAELYNDLPESSPGRGLKLKATFLLAIATPIISVPIERLARQKEHLGEEKSANGIEDAITAKTPVGEAPFYAGCWQYHKQVKGEAFPRLAVDGFPPDIIDGLEADDALTAAKQLSSNEFCSNLRNALSHGSVFYLDAQGRSSENIRVSRFAFVSTDRQRNPRALHIQSVTMADFRAFLGKWVDWLQNPAASNSDKVAPANPK